MSKPVYYNEFDPQAAAWLRELIKAGHIPAGDVDERSIEDVRPVDLSGYVQCHFFAGIGGWAYALDLAGWPRDRPVWTGSCPCQPFSAAGKGAGFADERHLWPAWNHLIAQCRPPVVFGEQVASKGADAWIDLVHADLEGLGYAFGCIPFPAAGVGAPHIRDRNYWVGDASCARGATGLPEPAQWREGIAGIAHHPSGQRADIGRRPEDSGVGAFRLADADSGKLNGLSVLRGIERNGEDAGRSQGGCGAPSCGEPVGLADAEVMRRAGRGVRTAAGLQARGTTQNGAPGTERSGPVNGHWRAADWLRCRDDRWRPVEPGTFPLAHGLPARVGRLRGYGNAIVPQQAAEFVSAYLETRMSLEQAA